ncbi:HlyD family efflux transporter periplasmic adaptor subunit [Botrimarina sp.]|uniref:efflux RND transporter periplasmic adaptor subunit n=1 Tax=Botrimarina sp. TaxID=2795802 RepID=UPI0032EB10C0
MHNWLGRSFFFLIGALVVGGLVLAFWPQPVSVEVATAARDTVLVTVDEDGKTRIREKYVVSAPLSGRLLRIEMDPGDTVTAGQTLLAVIQPRDPDLLDARAIAQAEARVAAARTVLERTAPLLEQARIEADTAEADLVRARNAAAAGEGVVTASELDNARARHRLATEAVRSALYDREIAAFELQQAEAALLRSRGDRGAADQQDWAFPIRSPIDGRVLRVFQESAAVVTAGTPLLELGSPSDLEIEVDVLSSDAVTVEPGDRVLLERWGGEQPLEGRVRLVEPAGFTKVSSLGVEEQRVNVIIDLVDPPEERRSLGDGFRVEARIVTDTAADVLTVPGSALFRVADRWAVFRIIDGLAQLTPVELGRRNDRLAEVREGLAEGDPVVAHPSDRIADGVAVEPL